MTPPTFFHVFLITDRIFLYWKYKRSEQFDGLSEHILLLYVADFMALTVLFFINILSKKIWTTLMIFDSISKKKLVELFELDEVDLVPEARLYQDLDIDSVDTVDLMVELKKYIGKDLNPKLFKDARTIDDVVNVIAGI